MKIFAAVALAALYTASAHAAAVKVDPKTVVTNCNTIGDALGSLKLTIVGKVISLVEYGMDGKVSRTKLEQSSTDPAVGISALKAGKPVNLWFRGPKNNEFGGGVANAGLLAIGGKQANGSRVGYLARTDMLYMLTCTP